MVFFSDVPAIVRIDGSRACSSVSCSFPHNFNVPRSVVDRHGESMSPLLALCAFPPWMDGTSLCSRFVLRIWTDATSSSGMIGSLLSVQHMSPLGFCGLLKRTLIGYLFIILGCFIRKVSVFFALVNHDCH